MLVTFSCLIHESGAKAHMNGGQSEQGGSVYIVVSLLWEYAHQSELTW